MKIKFPPKTSELKKSPILKIENPALENLGTEKIRQVLKASSAWDTYVMADSRVWELFL